MFGLCHLLGLRFAPRLRDLSERSLYIVDRRADYGALDCLIGGAINLRKIEENWDEILRMTASIRAGTVAPSVLMRRLAAYPRQNALARALREIGCLERTLFIPTGSQILRSDAVPTPGSTKARPETRSHAPCFFIVTARSGTAPLKISATGPQASTSRSPPSSSGTPSTSAAPLQSFAQHYRTTGSRN